MKLANTILFFVLCCTEIRQLIAETIRGNEKDDVVDYDGVARLASKNKQGNQPQGNTNKLRTRARSIPSTSVAVRRTPTKHQRALLVQRCSTESQTIYNLANGIIFGGLAATAAFAPVGATASAALGVAAGAGGGGMSKLSDLIYGMSCPGGGEGGGISLLLTDLIESKGYMTTEEYESREIETIIVQYESLVELYDSIPQGRWEPSDLFYFASTAQLLEDEMNHVGGPWKGHKVANLFATLKVGALSVAAGMDLKYLPRAQVGACNTLKTIMWHSRYTFAFVDTTLMDWDLVEKLQQICPVSYLKEHNIKSWQQAKSFCEAKDQRLARRNEICRNGRVFGGLFLKGGTPVSDMWAAYLPSSGIPSSNNYDWIQIGTRLYEPCTDLQTVPGDHGWASTDVQDYARKNFAVFCVDDFAKKYTNMWPHCKNILCSKGLANLKAQCLANANCVGFSYGRGSTAGCLKDCSDGEGAHGYGKRDGIDFYVIDMSDLKEFGPNHGTGSVTTWSQAVDFCKARGGVLATHAQYCSADPSGKGAAAIYNGQKPDDQWAPFSDYVNGMVQVGTRTAGDGCKTMNDIYGSSWVHSWITSTDKQPYESNYILCSPAP